VKKYKKGDRMKKLFLCSIIALVITLSVFAEGVPRIMSYQGKVTDMGGAGVNDTLPIVFRLYETPIAGAPIWSEAHPAVPITKGLFDVYLGVDTPLDLPFDEFYFLEIEIDGHAMFPRISFSSSPYSFRAIYADTAIYAKYADSTGHGGGTLQRDVDVPLTRPEDFGIIIGQIDVHGALVDLDRTVMTNRNRISTNETTLLTHIAGDHDLSPFNECVTWFHFDDLTDSLWIFDGAFPMATHIPNGPVAFDTLFTTDSLTGDTMLIMANFQVYGMLLADSIAAMGDFVHIFDSLIVHGTQWITGDLYVDGNLFFGDSLSANAIGVDTLWSQQYDITDTIVNMANVKIHGELIADSIQAVGDTIWLDDNIFVDGNAIIVDSVGIGTDLPFARLHVEGEPESYGEAVGYFQNNYVGTGDGAAVYGVSVPQDYWGIGVRGEGGYIGTYGEVYPTGSNYYFGVYGYVDGSDGYNFGVYGDAYGDGENYGLYGYAEDDGSGASINYGAYTEAYAGDENYGIYSAASGGSVNWAGYFADGDVNVDNDIYLYSGLYDGTSFGAHDQYLRSDGSDLFWDFLYGSLIRVDTLRTLSASDSDTIWTMAQLYVNGELIVDSIQAVGDTIHLDDNIIVHGSGVIDDDLIVLNDAWIGDSLVVVGNTYLQSELEVDLDAYFHDNLFNDDTIFANVIVADSITAFYLLATDVDVLESLYVDGPANFDSTVVIGDDTLYVFGPAMFDSTVVINPGHALWVDKIYGTVAGSLFVDTTLVVTEIVLDSIESWNGTSIVVKDTTYFREYVNIWEDLEVDGDGIFNQDVWIGDSLVVVGNTYLQSELEVDLDAYFHDNLFNDDTIFANVIVADSITAFYLLATDVDVLESLYVDGPANFDSTVVIGDDTLYVFGPAMFDSTVVINPGHALWVDKIYGTVAGSLFVDTTLVVTEIVLDSIESWNGTSIVVKDTTYFREYVNIWEDLEVDGDGIFNQDVWIGDSLEVVGNTYLQSELEVDLDAYFHDNLFNDDTIFANVIVADSITAFYLLATDVDVLESLYVDGPANFDSTVVIGDDTLYVFGPAMFDSTVVINPGHALWVDKIYGTVAGSLFVDTTLVVTEIVLDSIESWNGTSIVVKDTTYFREYVNIWEDLEVDGDGIFNQDVWIGDSLEVVGNTYLQSELEVDLDAYFHDNLFNDDTIFANVIVADSITAFYLLATDVDVLESLYVDGPANFDSTVVIGDDTLYVFGPAMFDSTVVINPGHALWVDRIYGTVAGSLFVDTTLVVTEIVLDSIESWNSGTVLIKDSVFINSGLRVNGDVFVQNGHRYFGVNTTGADSFWIYDDGDTTRFNADNPIKIGNASLVVETDGDVVATRDFYVRGNSFFGNNVTIAESLAVLMDATIGGDLVVTRDIRAEDIYTTDSLFVGSSMFVTRDAVIDRDLIVNDDVYIRDSLNVQGNVYFAQNALVRDNLTVRDSLEVQGDAIFHNDVTVGDSLFVHDYVRVAGDVWIGDNLDIMDSLMIWGPIVIAGAQPLYADTIYTSLIRGDVAGSLFVRENLVVTEIVLDSIEAWHGTSILIKDDVEIDSDLTVNGDAYLDGGIHDGTSFGTSGQILMTDGSDVYWSDLTSPLASVDTLRSVSGSDSDTIWTMAQFYINGELIVDSIQAMGDTVYIDDHLFVDGAIGTAGDVVLGDGAYLRGSDATGTDFFAIFDDGDTTRFESDNPIKIGDASLIVETGGDIYISGVLTVEDSIIGDLHGHASSSDTAYAMDALQTWIEDTLSAYLDLSVVHDTLAAYADTSVVWDTLEAYLDTTILSDPVFTGTATFDALYSELIAGYDPTGTDTFYIYDDGDTTRFESDNPIKIGDASLIVETGGNVAITGDLAIGGTLTGDGSGLTGITDADWDTAGNYLFPMNITDSVGIGTATPHSNLELYQIEDWGGSGVFGPILTLTSPSAISGVTGGAIDFNGWAGGAYAGQPTARIRSLDNNYSSHLVFQTRVEGAVPWAIHSRMSIRSSGQVGIGQDYFADPAYILDVNGDARFLGLNASFFPNDGFGKMYIKRPAWYECTIESDANLVLSSGGGSDIKVVTSPYGEAMRVLSTGEVGIGTTSPDYKLDVNGDARFIGDVIVDAGNRFVGIDATQADSFYIYDDGDTTRFESDNPIKIGDASLIVETGGNVAITGDVNVGGTIRGASMAMPIQTVPFSGYIPTPIDYTLLSNSALIGGPVIIQLPPAGTCPGMIYVVKAVDVSMGVTTIMPMAPETIDGNPSVVLGTANFAVTIQSDGVNWWVISEKVTP